MKDKIDKVQSQTKPWPPLFSFLKRIQQKVSLPTTISAIKTTSGISFFAMPKMVESLLVYVVSSDLVISKTMFSKLNIIKYLLFCTKEL